MSTEQRRNHNARFESAEESRNRAADADIYAITRGKGVEKGVWKKVGVAFKNRDGSINLKLDFFPRDPTAGLQVRWAEEGNN